MLIPDMTPLYDSEDYWAMLRAVYAHPKKQAPRMLLADWVEERGYFSLALKHRIDACAGAVVAFVRSDREVSLNKAMTAAKFWSQVADIHPADSPVWLELLWRDAAAEKFAKLLGPVVLRQTGSAGHTILASYRKVVQQMQAVGLHFEVAMRPDLWAILCDEFLNLQSLEVWFPFYDGFVGRSRLSEFHQLKRLTFVMEQEADFLSSLSNIESLAISAPLEIRNWDHLHALPLRKLHFRFSSSQAGGLLGGLQQPELLETLSLRFLENRPPPFSRIQICLSRFPNLRWLSLIAMRARELFAELHNILPVDLYHLHLDGIHPDGVGVESLKSWKGRENLRSLHVSYSMLGDEESLDVFPGAYELQLDRPADILAVKNPEDWTRLSVLKLGRWTGIRQECLDVLSRFPALKMIEVVPGVSKPVVHPADLAMWKSLTNVIVDI